MSKFTTPPPHKPAAYWLLVADAVRVKFSSVPDKSAQISAIQKHAEKLLRGDLNPGNTFLVDYRERAADVQAKRKAKKAGIKDAVNEKG